MSAAITAHRTRSIDIRDARKSNLRVGRSGCTHQFLSVLILILILISELEPGLLLGDVVRDWAEGQFRD